ncbi:MAG: SDR family oxidoreductase [Gammaproteobacteria bacterium]|nr:SDR family oxidoreductase [Gammaproteobacteria bacterium]
MTTKFSSGLSRFDLSGKTIIVTGGGYGLGKTMAGGLAAAGANVVVAGRTQSRLIGTVEEIVENGGKSMHCVTDVTDRASCRQMVASAVREYGGIEGIVINHGVIEVGAPTETSEEEWHRVVNTNLTGCFYCAQAAGRQLIDQGNGGSVVMISSNGSLVAFEGLTAYGASKGGVDMLCKQMAMEWGRYNIRVNTVNPGYTTHPMGGKYEIRTSPELEEEILKWTPLGRRGNPEDFVGPVIFLCSDASSFVNGHMLVVDGGYCAL